MIRTPIGCVALRKESVDRNMPSHWIISRTGGSLSARRAWIEIVITAMTSQISVSLSARRAWIEIVHYDNYNLHCVEVALRKESVDRNYGSDLNYSDGVVSLSARRAWIEIPAGCWRDSRRAVALRKESVDRNYQ